MNAAMVGQKPMRPSSSVQPTHSKVLTTRNGIRRRARSVIAPSRGDTMKISR